MDRNSILKKVNEIFIDVLDDEDVVVCEDTTANDVDGWDSLTHIRLVVEIEKNFKIKFTSKEIQSWKNVAEMLDCIETKMK
jgi:acyl carrier protein